MNYIRITKENIDREHICCAMSGKQSIAKKEWLRQRFEEGLVFYRSEERGKCFIEYIPAENAWVPIMADGWLYINCLWVSGSMKGHGYSNDLLEECIRDARAQGKNGLCILCAGGRKREFLADPKFPCPQGIPGCRHLRLRDRSDGFAACAQCGTAEVPGMRKASGNCRSRFRPVLHRSVPLHLLLGSKGAGGGKKNTISRSRSSTSRTKNPRRTFPRRSRPMRCSGTASF